jgi:protein-S-isoprenylcysteine O-methyltransferase Ste14
MNIQFIIYAAFLFFISEMLLLILKRSKSKTLKTGNDKRSLLFIWMAITFNMTLGFFAANLHQWNAFNRKIAFIGLGIYLFGIVIRWVSILQLKKEFTVDVSINKDHQLKTDGFYSYIRHPSYSGLLLICFGLSIAMNSWLSIFAVLPVVLSVLYRISIEENILIKEFGPAYEGYMKKTRKIVPKVF